MPTASITHQDTSLNFTPFDWILAHVTDQIKTIVQTDYPNLKETYCLVQDCHRITIKLNPNAHNVESAIASAHVVAINNYPTNIPLFIN